MPPAVRAARRKGGEAARAAGLNRLRKNSFGVSFRGAAGDEESRIVLNPNSEVARLDWKKPLTRLATLATLSPGERAVDHVSFQPSPEGRGWPAAGAFTSRSGPSEGSLLKELNTCSVLRPVNPGNSDSTRWPRSAKRYFGIRDENGLGQFPFLPRRGQGWLSRKAHHALPPPQRGGEPSSWQSPVPPAAPRNHETPLSFRA
jgi:hypothetical protein